MSERESTTTSSTDKEHRKRSSLGHGMTSRLTRPSPSSRPSRRNPGQSGVLFRRDRLSPNQLNHQDPFILRHGSQPTANRLPLLSRGDLCKAHCSVLVRRLDTFASCSTPTARRPRTCGGYSTKYNTRGKLQPSQCYSLINLDNFFCMIFRY